MRNYPLRSPFDHPKTAFDHPSITHAIRLRSGFDHPSITLLLSPHTPIGDRRPLKGASIPKRGSSQPPTRGGWRSVPTRHRAKWQPTNRASRAASCCPRAELISSMTAKVSGWASHDRHPASSAGCTARGTSCRCIRMPTRRCAPPARARAREGRLQESFRYLAREVSPCAQIARDLSAYLQFQKTRFPVPDGGAG